MNPAAWVDGQPAASVPLDDRGLMYGDGVFETIVCRSGEPRFLALHLARLADGCAALGIAAPPATTLAADVRRAGGEGDSLVRLTVTRGSSSERGYAPPAGATPRRIVQRHPLAIVADAAAGGIRACHTTVVAGVAPQLAGFKHLNRLENVLARSRLAATGCAEAVLSTAAGAIVGGTMSNLFACIDGRLLTPPIDVAGVRGVMRAVVLREAAQLGLQAREQALRAPDLRRASEIFFTNVRVGIWPVRELEGWRDDGAPGPVAIALQARIAGLRD